VLLLGEAANTTGVEATKAERLPGTNFMPGLAFLVPGNKTYSDGDFTDSMLNDFGEGNGVGVMILLVIGVGTPADGENKGAKDLLLDTTSGADAFTCKAGKCCLTGCCCCCCCCCCGGNEKLDGVLFFAAIIRSSSSRGRKSIKEDTKASSTLSTKERGGGEAVGTGEVQVEDTADPLKEVEVEAIESFEEPKPQSAFKDGAKSNDEHEAEATETAGVTLSQKAKEYALL